MSSPWQTDAEHEELAARLRPRLTDEFLSTLAEAAELTLCDQLEVDGFVVELFHLAGKPVPDRYNRKSQ